ncbi:hypothetical protein SAMN06264855_1342 [Halorubrum vacuolatum]|uniref:Uncharacterized protein n=1 Tax=Halorubrum vacuolatum TaxID=63740 RepID=A0A238Y9W6_HALVU|nr:hypothetical protein SAMN06264855_1342 [Halorubrum vacuolatum]
MQDVEGCIQQVTVVCFLSDKVDKPVTRTANRYHDNKKSYD